MTDNHYDGDSPNDFLPPEHFTEEERQAEADVGDGSPAVEPRADGNAEKERSSGQE